MRAEGGLSYWDARHASTSFPMLIYCSTWLGPRTLFRIIEEAALQNTTPLRLGA